MTLVEHSCELRSFERTENVLLNSMNSSFIQFYEIRVTIIAAAIALRNVYANHELNTVPRLRVKYFFFSRELALFCRINGFSAVDCKNASLVEEVKLQPIVLVVRAGL